jgi:hypothetical protein
MCEWIGRLLDRRTETTARVATEDFSSRSIEDYFEQSAIDAAHYGDIEPLRKRYPHIAQFIHLPREGHRGKYPRRSSGTITCVEDAVEAAAFVRRFWREVYGRKNRSRDDLSAEAVVADYYRSMGHTEVTEDAIRMRAKTYRMPLKVAMRDAEIAHAFAERVLKAPGK